MPRRRATLEQVEIEMSVGWQPTEVVVNAMARGLFARQYLGGELVVTVLDVPWGVDHG